MEQDAAGIAALMVVHSLILALVEKHMLDPEEVHAALEDVMASRGGGPHSEGDRHEAAMRLTMQLADDIARARGRP